MEFSGGVAAAAVTTTSPDKRKHGGAELLTPAAADVADEQQHPETQAVTDAIGGDFSFLDHVDPLDFLGVDLAFGDPFQVVSISNPTVLRDRFPNTDIYNASTEYDHSPSLFDTDSTGSSRLNPERVFVGGLSLPPS
ncbi:hypothetical protein PG994_008727 [Apiospora phragmitis]|uniref:Uncharacterized protein n=1 Tax=Apiospora phragmitis TaxID=2905665 RepID=A0ABR1UKA8_9PEZI